MALNCVGGSTELAGLRGSAALGSGDLVLPVTNIRAGGTGTSGWEEEHPLASPQVDLAQDTETLRIMVLLKVLDHRQDS